MLIFRRIRGRCETAVIVVVCICLCACDPEIGDESKIAPGPRRMDSYFLRWAEKPSENLTNGSVGPHANGIPAVVVFCRASIMS